MNPKFILPASFALTAHVFLLFGLPGRAPAIGAPPEVVTVPPDDPKLRLANEDPTPVPGEPRDPAADANRKNGLAPRREDIPVKNPGPIDIVIPALPPIAGGPTVDKIPTEWVSQRERPNGTGDIVLNPVDLDRVPRARAQPAPVYPSSLRNAGVAGEVVVEFLVDESGNAYDPVIVTATRREFEEPALRAVGRWKFEPGLKDGRRVRFRMSVPLVFRLDRE